jgi:DNA-binding MarR family transcriptional regulator
MYELTSVEQQQWRSIHRGITRLLSRLDRDLDSHSGLSLSEYSVLTALAESGETGVRMTQLAEASMLSKSRLSHCVDRLVESGLVSRERVLGDKRGFAALLTSAGFVRLAQASPSHFADVHRYLFEVASRDEVALIAKISDLIAVTAPRVLANTTGGDTIDLTA